MMEQKFQFQTLTQQRVGRGAGCAVRIVKTGVWFTSTAWEAMGKPKRVLLQFCPITRTLGIFPTEESNGKSLEIKSFRSSNSKNVAFSGIRKQVGLPTEGSSAFPATPYENGLIVSLPAPATGGQAE